MIVKIDNKKGELTSSQIIGLVLVLAGAVVIGSVLLVLLDTQGQDQRELCKLSVVTRATAGSFAQSNIPLACVSDKICFTTEKGKGNCKQFAGEEGVRNIQLSNEKDEAVKTILSESAFAMYDCWNTMGRGRMDLFGKAFQTYRIIDTKCVVCSRLAIADDVIEKFNGIQNDLGGNEFNEYLRVNSVPGNPGLTYLNAFLESSGVDTYNKVDGGFAEAFQEDRNGATGNVDEVELDDEGVKDAGSFVDDVEIAKNGQFLDLNQDQIAFVFAQRKTKQGFWSGLTTGVKDSSIVIVGGGITSGAGKLVAKTIGGLPAFILGVVAISGTGLYAGTQSYANQQASAAYCGSFVSGEGTENNKAEGCSVVRGVPYKAEYINQICGAIEGGL